MAKPKTIHTKESIYAKTTEKGDCRDWKGYMATESAPMVMHDGKMVPVRKLLMMLDGKLNPRATYFGPKCGNKYCVEQSHISQRNKLQHYTLIGKKAATASTNFARVVKITKTRRQQVGKLNQEQALEIRFSSETGPVLAERYGISRTMVNRIKRGDSWAVEFGNPFAGMFTQLMAANDAGKKRA